MTALHSGLTPARVYARLLGYTRPHRLAFAGAIAGMLVYAAADAGFAMAMKPLVDGTFIERDPLIIQLMPFVVLGLFLIRGLASFTSAYGMAYVGRKVVRALRAEVFDKLLVLPAAYYDSTATGQLLAKMTYNVEQVADASTQAFTTLVRDTLTVVGLAAVMIYLSPPLAGFLFAVAPLIAGLIYVVSRRFRQVSARLQDSMATLTHVTEEVVQGHDVVKTFGGEDHERSHFREINDNNHRLNLRFAATRAAARPLVQFLAAWALAGMLFVATTESVLATLTAGTFASFVTAMLGMLGPLRRLTNVNAVIQRGIAGADSIFGFLLLEAEQDTGTRRLTRARGDIELESVWLAYDPDKGPVLKDVSMAVPAGATVAVVGRSGSGKSTVARLLARFYDPQQGRVTLDGIDLRDYRLADLRRQIALVPQDVTLFNDTVARNIAYGALEEVSRDQLMAAARAAHALEFIERLPDGMDTRVGQNGVLLSGGERQRLAIARAMLKDAPILVLDEATAALDAESEQHVRDALESLMRDRTTLVIAHRLSSVETADRIVVIDEGRVVETGTHGELLGRAGHYASLHRMQGGRVPEGSTATAR